jgi:hypothetical protein
MEPNIEAINKKIDAMTDVINVSVKEIRAAVDEIIGKPLIEPMPPLRSAQVWRNDMGYEMAIFRECLGVDKWISVWIIDHLKGSPDGMCASGHFCGSEATLRQHLQLGGFKLIGTAELTVKPL